MSNTAVQMLRKFVATHRQYITNVVVIACGVIALLAAIAFIVQASKPKIVYQPAFACDLLTQTKAEALLGSEVIRSVNEDAVISGDTATSKCGYTDKNQDVNQMRVAAVIVRSGINDQGVEQNRTEFALGKPKDHTQIVSDVGDAAYYNTQNGQLNVLDDKQWLILSYGVGAAPEANDKDEVEGFARLVLNTGLNGVHF